ncbi:MAG: hypothetical protein ACRESK_07095, partial [Gammaproteobacteria bacterium]
LVLLPFTGLSIFSLLFSSAREIVYEQNKVFEYCTPSGTSGNNCTALHEIIIGNTGTEMETVRLVWPFDLSLWERGQKILNIAADEPRNHDPEITCETSRTQSVCVLEDFATGTLVIMKFSCLACSGREIGLMEGKAVAVETIAPVAQGDPRVNILFRRLQKFLNLFL